MTSVIRGDDNFDSSEAQTQCAQLANTVIYNIPDSGLAIVPFNTVLIRENITINPTASTVDGIEAYHWRHSTTGVFRIGYQIRTTSDIWNMISVCKNNNSALPVGNGYRSGSAAGAWGIAFECLYRVTDITDRFSLFHWCASTTGNMTSHDATVPPSTFFITPEIGTKPTSGYYSTIVISKM